MPVAAGRGDWLWGAAASAGLETHGKENGEGGAGAGLAFDDDPALMLLDNAIDGGQAQAGALADFLGGEKRLEEMAQGGVVHAAAGVGDAQADEMAGAGFGIDHAGDGFEDAGSGADGQASAVGHGVAGVDGEVDQDLFDHADVGVNGGQVRRRQHTPR